MVLPILIGIFLCSLTYCFVVDDSEKRNKQKIIDKNNEFIDIKKFKTRFDLIIKECNQTSGHINIYFNDYINEMTEFIKHKYLFETIKSKLYELKTGDINLLKFKMKCLNLLISKKHYHLDKNDLKYIGLNAKILYEQLEKIYNLLVNYNDYDFNYFSKFIKGFKTHEQIVVVSNFIFFNPTGNNKDLIVFNIKCCYHVLDNGYDIYHKKLN